MTANPLLAAFAPAIEAVLTDLQTRAAAIVAAPTVENAVAQGEGIVGDAINPVNFEGLGIGGIAQEFSNIIAALQAHLASAVAAPTAAVVPAAS